MAGHAPPEGARMEPLVRVVPAGTELYRCHRDTRPPGSFNPSRQHTFFDGDRFGATEQDPFVYLYAALDPVTALSEVLLRSVRFDGPAAQRRIPWARASRYCLSVLRTTTDLALVDLMSAEGLAAVWQDSWLVDAERDDYAKTRYWVRLIREHAPDVQGLVWQSKRHRPREALQLFGDRCGEHPLEPVPERTVDLRTEEGVAEARRLLGPVRATVSEPEPAAVR
ncbi:RES family NAD+ phosphorylase [Streptomyces xinghaiensis]|uniref:RES family NAD+ phosphorylase n=1 Tax=Streptomyces xinghaiensis TaxID=1038928 RepID=UPI0003135941|nr:RES family NAD+ phosphorylase [Streptomyces xinghaiensis]MZE76872.1 RES domain-containing protein [Streptomyces sp. SID5475]